MDKYIDGVSIIYTFQLKINIMRHRESIPIFILLISK